MVCLLSPFKPSSAIGILTWVTQIVAWLYPPFRFAPKCFSQNFFDFYQRKEKESSYVFRVKPKLFLENYRNLLTEFYDIIEEDFTKSTGFEPDSELLRITDIHEFYDSFGDRDEIPNIDNMSVATCGSLVCLLMYLGSYKAYFKDLSHFERAVGRAMKNPLAGMAKIGMLSIL